MARVGTGTARPGASRRNTFVLLVTLGATSACLTVPSLASTGSGSDRVIVCETGIERQGDALISASVATRVGPDAPVPEGCREG